MVSTITSQKRHKKFLLKAFNLFSSTGRLVAKAKPRRREFVFQLCSNQRINLDRHQSKTFQRRLFCSVKIHDQITPTISREDDGAVRFDDLTEKCKVKFAGALQWNVDDWENCLTKCGGEKRRFQYCMNPYSFDKFLYFRAIQGLSADNLVDSFLQKNVLLPDDFTEHINHIGNAFEMHSTIKSGLIPGGKSLRRDRQSKFFTAVNPMCARQDLEGVEYDLDKPRIAPCKHAEKAHHNTVYWCNLKLAQRKGLQFYQTRSHAITLSSALPVICKEKAVWMKTGEVYRSPRLHRATLVPNSQHDQKDVLITDSRKSDDCENEVNKQRWTCSSSRVDFRIPNIPHSTVEKVETNQTEKVLRFIEQFENHPNRNRLLKDFQKSDQINHCSQESKDLITEMDNTEIFEFYETSSKRQCPDCASNWEFGIVHCTCGKCVQLTAMNRQYNNDRFDTLCEQNSLAHCVYRRRHFVGTSHWTDLLHARACLKLCLP